MDSALASQAPTLSVAKALHAAWSHYNEELFDGELPPVVITLQRKTKARGYFSAKRLTENGVVRDEIALNPQYMQRPVSEILSTLVHEMVHQWQFHHGETMGRGHNREWADKMLEVGLQPVALNKQGAPYEPNKETGSKCTHEIIPGALFDALTGVLLASGWQFSVSDNALTDDQAKRKVAKRKTKYTCPSCEANVWGKPDMHIMCGDCDEPFEVAS